jgi:hypothetical protein
MKKQEFKNLIKEIIIESSLGRQETHPQRHDYSIEDKSFSNLTIANLRALLAKYIRSLEWLKNDLRLHPDVAFDTEKRIERDKLCINNLKEEIAKRIKYIQKKV